LRYQLVSCVNGDASLKLSTQLAKTQTREQITVETDKFRFVLDVRKIATRQKDEKKIHPSR